MPLRGKPLTSVEKKLIVSVKQYFDRHPSGEKAFESSTKRAADAVGVGEATVKRIMADYNRDPELLNREPKERGRREYSIDISYQEQVRKYVREANQKGEYITLKTINNFLVESGIKESFHRATLARTLDRWGFEFGKGTRTQHLKEKDHVIVARKRYLRRKMRNRQPGEGIETIRPEVYLDETYVNKNHSNDFIWYSGEDGPWVQKPTGKGERLIIVNAMTQNGWIPDAKLVYKSTKRTGDYHGQMNTGTFSKWFADRLIPNIPKESLIIMDNASYHNVLSPHSAPTSTCSKAKILKWLEQNKIVCSQDCLKLELVEMLKKVAPEPTYRIDEIAAEYGHEVIRTPPYHPELQPIETCWGVVKNYVARHCDFSMQNLIDQLDDGFKQVTLETCKKIIAKVKKIEDDFWIEDMKSDALEEAK